jgi:hypothetical protein
MKPLKSKDWPDTHILNPKFVYRNAASTDVRATMDRERERLRQERARPGDYCELPRDANVSQFVRSKMK